MQTPARLSMYAGIGLFYIPSPLSCSSHSSTPPCVNSPLLSGRYQVSNLAQHHILTLLQLQSISHSFITTPSLIPIANRLLSVKNPLFRNPSFLHTCHSLVKGIPIRRSKSRPTPPFSQGSGRINISLAVGLKAWVCCEAVLVKGVIWFGWLGTTSMVMFNIL